MKHQRLLVVGESYMEPFVQEQGHLELARRLGIPETHCLVFPGSAIDQCIRSLIEYMLEEDCSMLVVWGLTFVSRFDVLLSEHGDNPHISKWASFNGNDFNAVDKNSIIDYENMLAAARTLSGPRNLNYDELVKDYLNRVIAAAAFIKGRNSDHIIYSQCGIDCKDFVQKRYIQKDLGFIDPFGFAVNGWLQSQGVPLSKIDLESHPHLPKEFMHPARSEQLVMSLCDLVEARYRELFRRGQ